MVDVNKLDEELGDADSEQLQYIYDTQKDLYSAEELAYILKLKAMRVQEEDAEEKALLAKAEEYLPKEINCPKCDGPNDFHNDVCRFCGAKLKKAEYYNRARNMALGIEDDEDSTGELDDEERRSFLAQYIISFLIPLVGWIMGGIFLTRNDSEEHDAGIICIMLGIASGVLVVLLYFYIIGSAINTI